MRKIKTTLETSEKDQSTLETSEEYTSHRLSFHRNQSKLFLRSLMPIARQRSIAKQTKTTLETSGED